MNLASHEWASLYKQLEAITKNGGNSIRHLEGCVLIIMEEIEARIAEKRGDNSLGSLRVGGKI